jgi:hypothetical protein
MTSDEAKACAKFLGGAYFADEWHGQYEIFDPEENGLLTAGELHYALLRRANEIMGNGIPAAQTPLDIMVAAVMKYQGKLKP